MKTCGRLARAQLLFVLETDLRKSWRTSHEAARERCALGALAAFAAASAPTPFSFPRAQALGLSEDSHRHPVRAQDRHCLGRPPRRTGLRLWQDLPTLPAALAPCRCLDPVACSVAGRTERGG